MNQDKIQGNTIHLHYQNTAPPSPELTAQVITTIPKDSIVESIVSKFQQRSAVGWKKYGTTLDRNDLGILDWIQHAQEELMDGILYLEKLKKVLGESTTTDAGLATDGAADGAAGSADGAAAGSAEIST